MRFSSPVLLSALALLAAPALAQTVTPIGTIQGGGATATAGTYTVEAVVTAVYPSLSPAGFYVQNDAASADGDPATSDALFVVQNNATVSVGDRLRITGEVVERSTSPSFGQAVLSTPAITPLGTGAALPAFVTLDSSPFSNTAIEQFEGMRVQFAQPLTVADVSTSKSQGTLLLSARGPLYQPTQVVDPNDALASGTSSSGNTNAAAVTAYAAENATRTITLDDGRASGNPSPIPYLDPTSGTVRVGGSVPSLRGILSQRVSKYVIQPLPGPDAPQVSSPRPAAPTFPLADVKLASFNVLNYFNGNGAGGGFPTSRGATTLADFERQRLKIIAAITQLNPDVAGLMEIENDGTGPASAIQDLLAGLNAATAPGTYALIDDGLTRQPGTSDLIRCAIIYKPAALAPVGPVLLSTSSVFERSPVAQVFRTPAGQQFALVVNHFKSKASGSGLNADQGDGQGPSNLRRTQQAQALVQFFNNTVVPAGTPNIISVGDYNANYEEDPLDVLRAAGLLTPAPAASISYVYNSLSGSLDHAVVTPNLANAVEVHKWNINAVEPEYLEYDIAGPATDTSSPFRSSDHDPVAIGLTFANIITATAPAAKAAGWSVYPNPAAAEFTIDVAPTLAAGHLTVDVLSAQGQKLLHLHGPLPEVQQELSRRSAALGAGLYVVRLRGEDFQQTKRVTKL
jgi:predicted extracellular nuclease